VNDGRAVARARLTRVSRSITRVYVSFDDPNLVANAAGLLLTATMAERLGLEARIDATVKLGGRAGGACPGRKVMTLTHAMIAGGIHIDHARRQLAQLDGLDRRVPVETRAQPLRHRSPDWRHHRCELG
jgi:hypothetical protein